MKEGFEDLDTQLRARTEVLAVTPIIESSAREVLTRVPFPSLDDVASMPQEDLQIAERYYRQVSA